MAAVNRNGSSREAREIYELKQNAVEYYNNNGVPKKMEAILNSMFYDNPGDVYGHLANYFESFSNAPVISKLKAREVPDSRGQVTLQTQVYCTVKNKEKLVSTSILSVESSDVPETKDAEDAERQENVCAAIGYIEGVICERLAGLDPRKQEEADVIVREVIEKMKADEEEAAGKDTEGNEDAAAPPAPSPTEAQSVTKAKVKSAKGKKGAAAVVLLPEEPKEKMFVGSAALCGLSQALCKAAAKVQDIPEYEHIAALRFEEPPQQFRMPQPMVTLLGSGKAALGKLNCVKEYMVIPKPGMPLKDSIKHITSMYHHIAKTLSVKGGAAARYVNDLGALCPLLDRPEQGLDMIQEAITSVGLTPGEDFHIALNCAGHEYLDLDKGKYDVIVGSQKLAEDLADFWGDILTRYPSVIALIDPMRRQDKEKEAWMKLCERVSEKCYVVGDHVYHRPGLLKHEEITEDFKTSGIILKLEEMTTITDILQVAKKMEDAENQVVVSSSAAEASDTLLADLAVGLNARFIKIGAPCRGERIAKLTRLLEIESELDESEKLEQWGDHTFPHITPPPPPPEEEDPEKTSEQSESPAKKK